MVLAGRLPLREIQVGTLGEDGPSQSAVSALALSRSPRLKVTNLPAKIADKFPG
jgi:hypothetical protein